MRIHFARDVILKMYRITGKYKFKSTCEVTREGEIGNSEGNDVILNVTSFFHAAVCEELHYIKIVVAKCSMHHT